jgi:O-acetyl-ADP-ribose deacetylase (regulator of RNase III)
MDVVVSLIQGDITTVQVDAIVNAANSSLLGGGGVDGAIHRVGGQAILEECRLLGGCDVGDAKATTAGRLPARYVIHTVGPVWNGGELHEDARLASAHRRSVEVAGALGVTSIAFPAISTGIFGFPIERAAPIAIQVARMAAAHTDTVRDVRFVLFSPGDFAVFAQAADALGA